MDKNFYSLGLMSGTSMDGIDLSIIKSDGEKVAKIIDEMYMKYDPQFKKRLAKIVKLCTSKNKFTRFKEEIDDIERELTFYHAKACNLIIRRNKNLKLDLIGFHGQTILHKPKLGYSIQIGDPQLLSKLTKTTVISKFRENDILHGGQGAPLASIYHKLILNKIRAPFPCAIVNIGGISNITYLEKKNKIISFDIGPGNCLIDEWIKKHTRRDFDKWGMIAKSGNLDQNILNKFLKISYFQKKPPKSLDIKDFNLSRLKKLNLKNGTTTLSMLTTKAICFTVNSLIKYPNLILISGGGRKNKFIVDNIKKKLKCKIYLIDKFNYNGDFIESQAFAYLAIRSHLKKFITFPSITGVQKACSGGVRFKD